MNEPIPESITAAVDQIADNLRATGLFEDVRVGIDEETTGGYRCDEGPFVGMSFGGDDEC